MRIVKWLCLALFTAMVFNLLHGQQNRLNTEITGEALKVAVPNPIDLQADWLTFFETDGEVLEARIQKVQDLLDSFHTELETTEEIREAETQIKEFQSHLESLILLKNQVIEQPSIVWLPKTSYSLDDYLEISDNIRYQLQK